MAFQTLPFPLEIREQIYKVALLEDVQPTPLKLKAFIPLCGVSRQLYDETYSIYLCINHFVVQGSKEDWAWFEHYMKNDPEMLQLLQRVTLRFHRPFRAVRSIAKPYKLTSCVWQALLQCTKIELTISCRLDELLNIWSLGMLDKLPACRTFTISSLPTPSQSCDMHRKNREPLNYSQMTKERRTLYAWSGVHSSILQHLKTIYMSEEDHNRLADAKSSFSLHIEHGGRECYPCLMDGASSVAEHPPCRYYQDGGPWERYSRKGLQKWCSRHGSGCG